jgi:glycosyltransferase involved in cell wall biosynthesis
MEGIMMSGYSEKLRNGENLKIAMLGHKRIPSREGGIEIVVEKLSARMVEQGHEVTCYNRKGHHVSGKEFDPGSVADAYRGVKLKSVATINIKGFAALTASVLAAFKTAFGNYDIVHFHAEGPCAMLWLPRLLGKRCIATIHGLDWKREKWKNGIASKYIKFGEKVAVKYADEIIVLSEGVQGYFKDTYGRETHFIPNGVSRPEIREPEGITKKFGLHKDEYILFLGRIVPEKGIRYLIEAFKNVKTTKNLIIAGGASDTDEFLNELKLLADGDERIIFTGFVQGQLLEELYSNAYLYILPSDLEGMPLSLLEAMSYGNCCLTSNIAECTEVVEDKAVVFQKSDVTDLIQKIQMLCEDVASVQGYKAGAADFICRKYSWDDVVLNTLRLYYGKFTVTEATQQREIVIE